MSDDEMVIVASGYGANSHQPFVEVRFNEERVQLNPEDASEIGGNMIEAAEAALHDAYLVDFLVAEGLKPETAAKFLGDFRVWRGKRMEDSEGE